MCFVQLTQFSPLLHHSTNQFPLQELQPNTTYTLDLFYLPHNHHNLSITNDNPVNFTTLPEERGNFTSLPGERGIFYLPTRGEVKTYLPVRGERYIIITSLPRGNFTPCQRRKVISTPCQRREVTPPCQRNWVYFTSLPEERGNFSSLPEERGNFASLPEVRGYFTTLPEEREVTSCPGQMREVTSLSCKRREVTHLPVREESGNFTQGIQTKEVMRSTNLKANKNWELFQRPVTSADSLVSTENMKNKKF